MAESGRPDRFCERPGYCRACAELPLNRLVRIVIRERWTVLVLHFTIENGILRQEAEFFWKFRENFFEQTHMTGIEITTGGSVTDDLWDREILAALFNTMAEQLEIDLCFINRSVENILTLDSDILIDFNLVGLICMSKKELVTMVNEVIRGNWLEKVSKYTVIPMHTESVDRNQFKSYFECIHTIQRSFRQAISWHIGKYFYRDDMYPRINTYHLFKRKKRQGHNPNVLLEVNDIKNIGIHTARILRYSPDVNVHDMDIADLLQNRFMNRNHGESFIVSLCEKETNTYVFYMVLEIFMPEYMYNLLVVLRELLDWMSISSIEIRNINETCNRRKLNFRLVWKMISYVFMGSGILVIVPRKKKSHRYLNLCLCRSF